MACGGNVRIKVFTEAESMLLQKHFNKERHNLDIALIEVLYQTGCRCSELVRIRPRDINASKCTIRIHRGAKGSDARTCDVKQELCFVLLDLAARAKVGENEPIIKARRTDGDVEPIQVRADKAWVERHWHSLQEKLFGEVNHGTHTFRHNFARLVFLVTGKNIKAVQISLGHKSATSTMLYLNYFMMQEYKAELATLIAY